MAAFNHVGLVVTNLERSKHFYEEVLGFVFWYEIQPRDDLSAKLNRLEPPLATTASYLVLDGFVLELIHYGEEGKTAPFRARTMDEPGLTHLSIAVEDIHRSAAMTVEHGGHIVEESDVGLALFVRDPDGQLIELLPKSFRDRLPPRP
jgi:lactoylglutathione lyase